MACFVVPAAEAIVTSVVRYKVAKDETPAVVTDHAEVSDKNGKFSWKTKLSWLNTMLWGGAILLCLEHVWHGEVTFYPPFLTAMAAPAEMMAMFREMATVGVGMTVLITLVWIGMCVATDRSKALRAAIAGKKA